MKLPCLPSAPVTEFRTLYIRRQEPGAQGTAFSAEEKHKYFPDNVVVTSKYTWWNFVPKNLFEQFRRIANFYFLIIVIIQFSIGDAAPVSPATSLLPLAFVIFITALKQGYEDWRRHVADREVNNRPAVIVCDGEDKQVQSKDLKVGDIVKVLNHDEIPCDIVVISTSDDQGKCYIMTANLDGETNLKLRESLSDTAHMTSGEQLSGLSGIIECDHPEYDMYKYNGRLHLHGGSGGPQTYALGLTNLLLRGAKLKNTEYAYGVVAYTGEDTKMAQNQKGKTHKFSTIEKKMNTFLLLFLGILLLLTIICTSLKFEKDDERPWYLPKAKEATAKEVVVTLFSFLVLFNYIIPISLYVTVEVQKFFGAMFFNWDEDLYHEATNEPAIANTSDLNEELGQIEYVFSDKTGTLTENDMQFRKCSIDGMKFVEVNNKLCKDEPSSDQAIDVTSNLSDEIKHFLFSLTLCHTVQADEIPNAEPGKPRYAYQSSSPDEKALCEAAARYGVVYKGKDGDFQVLEVSGKDLRFKLLHTLDFDTTRKRMSVIVEDGDGKLIMFCKGADSSVLPLCTVKSDLIIPATKLHIDSYAKVGLRTLVIASRELTQEEYQSIDERLDEAQKAISDREAQLARVFEEVENQYQLLGATAVEDKLQDHVTETMVSLREAGIKIWVLTGDKLETAVNISNSCGHFNMNNKKNLFYVTKAKDPAEINSILNKCRETVMKDPHGDYALVVDGSSLAIILNKGETLKLQESFIEVGQKCRAVLCCRMSPLQKAEVVRIVKLSKERPITLAIGDGANDCSMILEAHVGCGIMGKEGRQAVRCSDYAFHRFHFLRRVLFVHGHYFYTRLSNTVQYFFYKNVAFMLPQFLYQIWNGFSTMSLYASIFLTCYNIFFSSLPVLFYGMFEKDVKDKILYNHPHLYKELQHNTNLSWKQFLFWSLAGIWHGLVMFFGTKELYGGSSFSEDMVDYGLFTYGTFVFALVVIVTNLKMGLLIHYWTWFMHLFVWGSLLLFAVVVLVFCGFVWPWPWIKMDIELDLDLYNVVYMLFDSAMFWLACILIIALSLLPDVILTVLARYICPSELHKAQVFREDNSGPSSRLLSSCPMNELCPKTPSVSYQPFEDENNENNAVFV